DTITYHRGATLPINGAIRVAERYAIDFVQLDDKNKIASGPIDKLSSYAFFGREIYSVADGTVVAMADDRPEQVPGKLPEGMSLHRSCLTACRMRLHPSRERVASLTSNRCSRAALLRSTPMRSADRTKISYRSILKSSASPIDGADRQNGLMTDVCAMTGRSI